MYPCNLAVDGLRFLLIPTSLSQTLMDMMSVCAPLSTLVLKCITELVVKSTYTLVPSWCDPLELAQLWITSGQWLLGNPPLCYCWRQSNRRSMSWCLSHFTSRHHALSDGGRVYHSPSWTICSLCASGYHNACDGCCAYAGTCGCVWTCVCCFGSLF